MKDLDWSNLSFGYRQTDYNVRCYYRDGKWGEIEVCSDEYLKLHMAATCLHYGQEAFEGLKGAPASSKKVILLLFCCATALIFRPFPKRLLRKILKTAKCV